MNLTRRNKNLIFSIVLIFMAGLADAQAFLHASQVWQGDRLVFDALAKAVLSFTCSISTYVFTIRYLQRVGIVIAEIQLILWFSITIIGVSVLSGAVFQWPSVDRLVALVVVVGICWLIVRTKE